MGILCLIDVNISMMLDKGPAEVNGVDESPTSGYVSAVTIVGKLLCEISTNSCEEDVTIYRGSKKIEGIPFDKMEETLLQDKSFVGALSMSAFFKQLTESKAVDPTDTIIVFTDMKTYKADIDYFAPCNVRFVNVIDCSSELCEKQSAEVLEVANMSLDPVSKVVRKEHFAPLQIADFSPDDVVSTLMKHHFCPGLLTISVGFFKQNLKLSPPSSSVPIGGLYIVGFVKATSMVNAPTVSHHKVVPVVPSEDTVTPLVPREDQDENMPTVTQPKTGGKRAVPNDAESSSEGSDTPTKKMECEDSDDEKTDKRLKVMEKRMRRYQVFQRFMKRRLRILRRMNTRPVFLDIVAGCLLEEEMVAICSFKTGQYSVLNAITDEDGETTMFLSVLPEGKYDFQADLDDLIMEPMDDEAKEPTGADLHIAEKEGVAPSYDSNYRCWTTSQGISMDVQKLFRLLRKLPDKHAVFYQEVNSFRDYAILLGLTSFLKEMASILVKESTSMSDVAQNHAKYVAAWFEKTIDPTDYCPIPAL